MSSIRLEAYLEELHSKDPKIRIKACERLQQLGDPSAITELSKVYQNPTEDAKVREAAAKTLRYFAVKEGGGGGSKLLRNFNVLLGLLLVVLIGLNAATMLSGDPPLVATPIPRETLVAIYESPLFPALSNVEALRGEYQTTGETLPCTGTLQAIPVVPTLTPLDAYVYPDLGASSDLASALDLLNFVTQDWQTACQSGGVPQNPPSVYLDALTQIEGFLTTASGAIAEAKANPAPTNPPPADGKVPNSPTPAPTDGPSPTPTITPTPTNTPLPTIDPPILSRLAAIVTGTTQELESLKTNRWEFAQTGANSPFGCAGANIELEDFTQAPDALLQAEPDLATAVILVNEALALARASNQAYVDNCQNQSFNTPIVEGGIAQADQALEKLTLAQAVIEQYQGRR